MPLGNGEQGRIGRGGERRQSDRPIDLPTPASWKQVSPRKTELIRKILIFIHTHDGAGRRWRRWCWSTGRKSVLEIPGGTKSGWQDYPFL